ncbi:MAG: hypothetical protein ACK4VP_05595 [Nitrospira sp.]
MLVLSRVEGRGTLGVALVITLLGLFVKGDGQQGWAQLVSSPQAPPEQVVEVIIKDYKFMTKQGVLRLGLPTAIFVRNEDTERHDFGSMMFEGLATRVEQNGVIVYGRGLNGFMLDPNHRAVVRFDLSRPGKHEFRCSLHPAMVGELLILSVEAV